MGKTNKANTLFGHQISRFLFAHQFSASHCVEHNRIQPLSHSIHPSALIIFCLFRSLARSLAAITRRAVKTNLETSETKETARIPQPRDLLRAVPSTARLLHFLRTQKVAEMRETRRGKQKSTSLIWNVSQISKSFIAAITLSLERKNLMVKLLMWNIIWLFLMFILVIFWHKYLKNVPLWKAMKNLIA